MKNLRPPVSAVWVGLCVLCASAGAMNAAQSSAEAQPVPAAEELSQAELLKAYLQVREQLHATQMAIVNNRVEALTEKLESVKANVEVDRSRQTAELQRAAAERDHQQLEAQRSNRMVLWIAATFGGVGLLAMLIMPIFQWRAIARITEANRFSPQLVPPPSAALLPAEAAAADHTVSTSTQRLTTVIDRMQQRILELEHTAVAPASVSPTSSTSAPSAHSVTTPSVTAAPQNAHWTNGSDARRSHPAPDPDQATWITVLLNKGKSLLASNKPREAVACFDEILKLDPEQPETLVRKGSALERMNRFEEALQCYERAIVADSKMTLAYVSKGGVCNRLGRFDEALECYEQALSVAEKK